MASNVVPILHACYPHVAAWIHCLMGESPEDSRKTRASLPGRTPYCVYSPELELSNRRRVAVCVGSAQSHADAVALIKASFTVSDTVAMHLPISLMTPDFMTGVGAPMVCATPLGPERGIRHVVVVWSKVLKTRGLCMHPTGEPDFRVLPAHRARAADVSIDPNTLTTSAVTARTQPNRESIWIKFGEASGARERLSASVSWLANHRPKEGDDPNIILRLLRIHRILHGQRL